MSDAVAFPKQTHEWKKRLFSVAEEQLQKLDLLQKYTSDENRKLYFDETFGEGGVKEEAAPSNSKIERRQTAVLKLVADSAEAAAFLFRSSGYNFRKLERLLEGVLIGVTVGLDGDHPRRLRIDTETSHINVEDFKEGLQAPEVQAIDHDNTVGKAFQVGSPIDKAHDHEMVPPPLGAEPLKSIIWCESETIGPSIAYAHTAVHVAEHISKLKSRKAKTRADRSMEILDLFSGSGYCARCLANCNVAWLIYCIDNAVTAKDARVQEAPAIFWLKMDAGLVGKDQVLYQRFDLVCADPPHGDLFEIAFCDPRPAARSRRHTGLLATIKEITDWLVVYPGHVSQLGRATAIREAISYSDWESRLLKVGSELVIVAVSPKQKRGFPEAIEGIVSNIKGDPFIKTLINAHNWEVVML